MTKMALTYLIIDTHQKLSDQPSSDQKLTFIQQYCITMNLTNQSILTMRYIYIYIPAVVYSFEYQNNLSKANN